MRRRCAPAVAALLALLAARAHGARAPSRHLRSAPEGAALQAARPPTELDLVNFAVSQGAGKASAEQTGLWSPFLNATLPNGKEVACLNCDHALFQAWVDEISYGPLAAGAEGEGPVASGGKHPNAPGYDKWEKSLAKKESGLLGVSTVAGRAANSSDDQTSGRVNRDGLHINVSVRNMGHAELAAIRPRLQQLWAERRLVLGYGVDPVHQRMDFIQALVSLARASPALVPEDCGRQGPDRTPYCGALLSGMQPVAKERELEGELGETFGKDFVWRNHNAKGLSAKELRKRVTNLLQALKKDFHFYRQGCLATSVQNKEKCSAAPTQMVGRIACKPEEDRLSDDCMYAELRQCSSGCGASQRFFEYARFHGPLALFETRKKRSAVMGQCEEFSRAGYALLAAAGYEARYVLDFTDHVWVEVKLPSESDSTWAWVHADPSEGVLDQPLMYEQGWGKQLTMIFAFTPWKIEHVTSTYTKDYAATVQRRGLQDADLQNILDEANGRLNYELPLKKWGYTAGFSGSKGRDLDEISLWAHFEGR